MMDAMFPRRTNDWLRMAAGFGLVLLLAAQQKLWPSAVVPAARPAGSEDGDPRQPNRGGQPHKRAAQPLPYLLPDTPAPRWPAAWNHASLRQIDNWRDGVLACGQRDSTSHPGPAVDAADARLAWHCFLETGTVPQTVPLADFLPPGAAKLTDISPTGPPLT
jgi:hypothetical protein